MSVDIASRNHNEGLTRRDVLIGAGALASAFASAAAFSGDAPGHRHEDHAPRHPQLLDAVNVCVDKGRRCIAHCLVSFREGDTSLADCASKVHEMEAICAAYSYLLSANSSYSDGYAQICKTACSDCENECRKHEDKHQECRECADACQAVVAALGKTFA